MHAICWLLEHRPSREMVWNDGQHFGRCTRCAAELIRSDRRWRPVPARHRIVWRDRTPADADWSRWNERFSPDAGSTPTDDPPTRVPELKPELKIVTAAVERRDPDSPGRTDDRRRAA